MLARDFIAEIVQGLAGTRVASGIVPEHMPPRTGSRHSLVDAGAKKSVRKGKGKITINGTDLLNTMQVKRTIRGTDFHHGEHGLPRDAGPGGIQLEVLAGARRSEPGRQRFGES